MTDVLLVGDVHLADKPPSSRTETYTEDILRKLSWIVDCANVRQVPAIIAGDMFHIKTPSRNSFGLVLAVWHILQRCERGVWIVPGNHDLLHDQLSSLASQPLGMLCALPGVHLLMGTDPELPGIVGIPYLTEFDGGDWKEALNGWLTVILSEGVSHGTHELVVTHAPIFPPGQGPKHYPYIDADEWAAEVADIEVHSTYYGHIHDSHGIYQASWDAGTENHHTFANHGAISRGSIHESTVNRWPTITMWQDGQFLPIPLPDDVVKPPAEVFKFAEAATKKLAASSAQAFTDALGAVTLTALTVEEVVDVIRQGNPPPNVMQIIEEVLEEAGA